MLRRWAALGCCAAGAWCTGTARGAAATVEELAVRPGVGGALRGADRDDASWRARAEPVLLVDCGESLAAGVAVGLLNRGGPVADCTRAAPQQWASLLGLPVRRAASPAEAVRLALARKLFNGTVAYDRAERAATGAQAEAQHISENAALSVAGVFDALPVAAGDPGLAGVALSTLAPLFDVRGGGARNASLPGGAFDTHDAALRWVMQLVLPRAHRHSFCFRPLRGLLVPYVAGERLVAVYVKDLERRCAEWALAAAASVDLGEMVARASGLDAFLDFTSSSHWDVRSKPLHMMGFAPGAFEATGFCTRNRTMGVTGSDKADSVMLMRSIQHAHPEEKITAQRPLRQVPVRGAPRERERFSNDTVYVAHIVSDGDNLDMMTGTYDNLVRRARQCKARAAAGARPCAPRAWTVSPTVEISAAALRLFYALANESGVDSFVLPPSGATYFYPAAADVDKRGLELQRNATVRAARLLDMQATVLWDFFFQAGLQRHEDYMRTFAGTDIRGIFYSSAPWLLSPTELVPRVRTGHVSDRVLRDPHDPTRGVVVFNELARWDGTDGTQGPDGLKMSIARVASLVASRDRGSLNFIYDISWTVSSDKFERYADRLARLHKHVKLVDHRSLIDLAFQKYGLREPLLRDLPREPHDHEDATAAARRVELERASHT
jgi:hypothetical protein